MSDKQTVFTDQAPAAIGPYSQAVLTGKLVFVSGQTPLDPATGGLVGENAADQAEQCLKNLKAILEKSGASLDSVVKTTVFLVDIIRPAPAWRSALCPKGLEWKSKPWP